MDVHSRCMQAFWYFFFFAELERLKIEMRLRLEQSDQLREEAVTDQKLSGAHFDSVDHAITSLERGRQIAYHDFVAIHYTKQIDTDTTTS